MLHLSIHHKDVAFGINEDIARNKVPYFVGVVGIASFSCSLLKAQRCHICVDHHLGGRMGISDSRLDNNRLDGTTIEAGKSIERISCIREDGVMHQNLSKQSHYATAIQKIVDFVDNFLCNISVIFIPAWTRNAQVKDVHYGNPIAIGFGHLFSSTLLCLESAYICLAISKLRFIYCAKSLELIGDCCDAAIFRILRSVTSLWNWLRNVMTHLSFKYLLQN